MSETRTKDRATEQQDERRLNMIGAINDALDVSMGRDDDVVVMGEDVGYFGGVSAALRACRRNTARPVFDTPINECGIIAVAVGGPTACVRCPKFSLPITSIPASTS